MTAAALLPHLSGVVQRTPSSWVAFCPAHNDRRGRSLCIRETDEGVLLLKCFAGCQVGDIVGAIRLDLSDLFPPRTSHGKPTKRPPILQGDVLKALHLDLLIIAQAARQIIATGLLPDEMRSFVTAVDHVADLVEAVRHG